MTGAWMLASTVVALMLACAAGVASRVLSMYRRAVLRWTWAGALALLFLLCGGWTFREPERTSAPDDVATPPTAVAVSNAHSAREPVRRMEARVPSWRAFILPVISPAVDRGLVMAALTASGALLFVLVVSALRLRGAQSR